MSAPTAAAASQKPPDLMWVSHVRSQDVTLTGDSCTCCTWHVFLYGEQLVSFFPGKVSL